MAYALEAIVGPENVLRAVMDQPAPGSAVLVVLRHGTAMLPMMNALFDAVTDGASEPPLGFWKLPGGFDRVLAEWSSAGPVAYIEAECFGGVGSQRAALWKDGHLAFGPMSIDDGQPWPGEGTPISQVLARLGVDRTGYIDEFDAVGLSDHRHTEDWLP